MSFGSELRHERESRGVSLAEISAGTKVSERYLRALEADAWGDLPGGIFNKGMVRGYCRHLGLDEADWLRRFNESLAAEKPEPDWSEFAENVKRSRSGLGAGRHRWWGVLLMLLALTALGWAVWRYVVKPRALEHRQETPATGQHTTQAG